MTKALTLSGSIRTGSLNTLLQRDMSERLRARGAEVTAIDLGDYPLPIFNEDLEQDGMPENAVALGKLFVEADIIFIASPEYNGGLTPLLVNTLAWISRQKDRPFRHAVFGMGGVSSGKLSTVMSLAHLRDTLTKAMALCASIDVRVGPGDKAFDAEGILIDETAISRADMLADQLMQLTTGLIG